MVAIPTDPRVPISQRALIQRVQISDATATEPPHIRVHFRDVHAARDGYTKLPAVIANDPRTALDLSLPMPTLTYAATIW